MPDPRRITRVRALTPTSITVRDRFIPVEYEASPIDQNLSGDTSSQQSVQARFEEAPYYSSPIMQEIERQGRYESVSGRMDPLPYHSSPIESSLTRRPSDVQVQDRMEPVPYDPSPIALHGVLDQMIPLQYYSSVLPSRLEEDRTPYSLSSLVEGDTAYEIPDQISYERSPLIEDLRPLNYLAKPKRGILRRIGGSLRNRILGRGPTR